MRIWLCRKRPGFHSLTGGACRSWINAWRSASATLQNGGRGLSGIASSSLAPRRGENRSGHESANPPPPSGREPAKRAGAVIPRGLPADGWNVVAQCRMISSDEVPQGAVKAVAELGGTMMQQTHFVGAAQGLPPVRFLVNNAACFAHDGCGELRRRRVRLRRGGQCPGTPACCGGVRVRHSSGNDRLIVNLSRFRSCRRRYRNSSVTRRSKRRSRL